MFDSDRNRDVPLLHISHDDMWENAEADAKQIGASPAQKLAALLSRLVDRAADAIAHATEAGLSDGLEAACQKLAHVLGDLAAQMPSTPEQCEQLSSDFRLGVNNDGEFTARNGATDSSSRLVRDHDSDVFSETLPPEETLRLAKAVKVALADAQQCLTEVPRAEIEELAGAALAAAQVAVSAAQSAVRRLKKAADREAAEGSSVVIEDLSVDGEGDSLGGFENSSSDCVVVVLRQKRRLWKPIWPRLKAWLAQPTLPASPIPMSTLRLVAAWIETHWLPLLAVCLLCWPVFFFTALTMLCGWIFLLWILAFLLPCVLITDALMQRVYATRRAQIDGIIDGGLRLGRLAYLSTRLTVRQCVRVVRSQVKRALNGRSVSDVIQEGLHDPLPCLVALGRFLTRLTTEVFGIVCSTWHSVAPLLRRSFEGRMSSGGMGRQYSGDSTTTLGGVSR